MNTIPGYVCECNLGYNLNNDNRSCVANANCSEGVCNCLDGFTDVSENGNGTLTTINCIGKFIYSYTNVSKSNLVELINNHNSVFLPTTSYMDIIATI